MRLCFIADGRSPHARNWIQHFVRTGYEVHLITTYPCANFTPALSSLTVVPLDFSARIRGRIGGASALTTDGSTVLSRMRGNPAWRALVKLRDRVAPWSTKIQAGTVRRLVERIKPDLVHAMRIPFEGILAASALQGTSYPLICAVWGNDFTMAAASSPLIHRMTVRALARADGLNPDCHRDLRLARELGFGADKPTVVMPATGGVQADVFYQGPRDATLAARFDLPEGRPVILNPRGVKHYVRNDNFFRAIPKVLAERPEAIFLGAMMRDNVMAEGWASRLNVKDSVRLLPYVTHTEMADLFRLADIAVSPTDHDGTPNTLLEAMACGSFPVASDLESVREWVVDGVNGLLCDQGSADSIAGAILRALGDEPLRRSAAEYNRRMIAERTDYERGMREAVEFYREVIARKTSRAAVH